ncbi:MAG: hypothetical protein IT427_09000 [Pirellulales bacterium]|nr:hypothetical protein [Pirellulales bacterium]
MSDLFASELVDKIHSTGRQMVVAITGGGSRAIAELLEVPGGSRTLLEAVVPYSSEALIQFLRGEPEQYCSTSTARAMAMAAYQRGEALRGSSLLASSNLLSCDRESACEFSAAGGGTAQNPAMGIGCTASLVSDRPKQGAHRVHVACQTADITSTHSLQLKKGSRGRSDEEAIAAAMVLNAIADAVGVKERLPLPLVDSEVIESLRTVAPESWRELFLGLTNVVEAFPSLSDRNRGEISEQLPPPQAVFPGAFHPLHRGHRQIAEIAARRLNVPVHFEISVQNVDKLPLDYTAMQQRAAQFENSGHPLWFTWAPTFAEKAAIFPGAMFIVGADTLLRIGLPQYYRDDSALAAAAIRSIAERGCRFLVFGRVVAGKFQTLDDLSLPPSLRNLCHAVPAEEFRADLSSTQLRREGTGA